LCVFDIVLQGIMTYWTDTFPHGLRHGSAAISTVCAATVHQIIPGRSVYCACIVEKRHFHWNEKLLPWQMAWLRRIKCRTAMVVWYVPVSDRGFSSSTYWCSKSGSISNILRRSMSVHMPMTWLYDVNAFICIAYQLPYFLLYITCTYNLDKWTINMGPGWLMIGLHVTAYLSCITNSATSGVLFWFWTADQDMPY
jgi:hypothetical protein